jgi:hypothetical protein
MKHAHLLMDFLICGNYTFLQGAGHLHLPLSLVRSHSSAANGFHDPINDPGGLPAIYLVIEKILHKWQKLGTLVQGNLLLLNPVDGLFQYKRFPLFLSELMSEIQIRLLTKQNLCSMIATMQAKTSPFFAEGLQITHDPTSHPSSFVIYSFRGKIKKSDFNSRHCSRKTVPLPCRSPFIVILYVVWYSLPFSFILFHHLSPIVDRPSSLFNQPFSLGSEVVVPPSFRGTNTLSPALRERKNRVVYTTGMITIDA